MKLRLHLTSRIVLIFVLFAAVLLAAVGLISYQSGRESLKAAAVSELLAVAIEKEAGLNMWLDQRTGDLEELAHASNLQQEISTLTGAGSDPSVAETARRRIVAELQPNVDGKGSGYVELFVIEPGGKVIASTDPAQEGKSKIGHLYFENGKNDSYLQAPYFSPDLKARAVTFAVPLRARDGQLLAVLAGRLDFIALGLIIQRRTGLRQTDDSYLVNVDRVFVTQPRFITEPVTLRRTIDTEAVRRCVGGNSGVVFAPDYGGMSSIFVYRWNAKRKLGLIVEIDEAEALAPARAFGRSILLISGLALIGAALVASRLARTITRPVRALHENVTNFAAGKTSTPLPGNARDELGLLATEFNKMAETISGKEAELHQRVIDAALTNEQLQAEISERKAAAEALRETEEKYRSIFEHSHDGIFQNTPEGRHLSVNPALARMLGFDSPEELIRERDDIGQQAYADPEMRKKFKQTLEENSSIKGFEYEVYRKDGAKIWISENARIVRDAEGRALYYEGSVQDITERKRAEAERNVISEIVQGVITTSNIGELLELARRAIGKVLYAENCFVALHDPRTDLLDFELWVDKLDPLPLPQPVGDGVSGSSYVLRTGRPLLLTNELKTQLDNEGAVRLIGTDSPSWLGVPLRTRSRTIGVLAVQHYEKKDAYSQRDVGFLSLVGDQIALAIERKLADEKLKRSEERLAAAQKMAHVGSWEWDVITNKVIWSDEEYRLFGLEPGEREASSALYLSFVHPDARKDAVKWFNAVRAMKKSSRMDIVIVRRDGKERILNSWADVVLDEAGNVVRVVGTSQDVTEREKAERALGESEERFQLVSRATNDAIWDWDVIANSISFSESFGTLFGYRAGEFESTLEFWTQRIHPDDRDQVMEGVGRVFGSEEESWVSEYRFRCADGSYAFVYDRGYVVRNAEGKPQRMVGAMMNMTERKRAEAERRVISEIVQGVITTSNIDGLLELAHRSIGKLLYAENCFVGLHDPKTNLMAFDLWVDKCDPVPPPQSNSKGFTRSSYVLRTGQPLLLTKELEAQLFEQGDLAQSGSVSASWLGVPLRTPTRTIGVLVVQHYEKQGAYSQRDVEFLSAVGDQIALAIERKRGEEELKRSEVRLAEAQQIAQVGSWELDLVTREPVWSDELFRLFGFAPGEIEPTYEQFLACVHPDDRKAADQFTENVLATRKPASMDVRVVHPDGRVRVLQRRASVMLDDSSKVIRMLGTAQDVTELRQKESELELARSAAEAANRAKSEFLANMSHEIRTPMNGIIGMTDLALETNLNREQHEYLGMVKSSAHSLLGLINDILDFSKIEAGKLELDSIDFSLRDCIGGMLKPLGLRADQKGLELVADIPAEVPDHFVGDPMRLRQILINLTANAIKFTERGEVVVSVNSQSIINGEGELHFSVSDTGIGIPQEKQAAIFEAFAQADGSTTRTYGGTGLGLSIASQLIQKMHGKIWLESKVGQGTTFHFTACLGVRDTPAAQVKQADPCDLAGLRALVVDDNAVNRRILREMLTKWRMNPTLAESGQAALDEMLRAAKSGSAYQLVLLDAVMPEMDGFALAERIKDQPELSDATVMMLSSAMPAGSVTRCGELGIAGLLTKPVTQSELLDAILVAINRGPEDETAQPPETISTPTTPTNSRLRILVAEDNLINRAVSTGILEKQGHLLVHAATGREAVEAFSDGAFDLILMDVQMPEMDGFEATRRIRELEEATGGHIPIVAMTAHAMAGDRERCLAAGMDDYVSKPLRKEDLLRVLDRTGVEHDEDRSETTLYSREELLSQCDGDEELMSELVSIFRDNTPEIIQAIGAAVEKRDAPALATHSHKLLSSLGAFGAEHARILALRLEKHGQKNDFEGAKERSTELERETDKIYTALADFVSAVA